MSKADITDREQMKIIKRFIDFFNSEEEWFTFQGFTQFLTPVKCRLDYKLEDGPLIQSLCFNILNNLCYLFNSKNFNKRDFSGFGQLITSVYKLKTINDDARARLFYALHISKNELILKRDFILNSIEVENADKSLTKSFKIDSCMPLIRDLITNKIITKNVIDTIRLLTNNDQTEISYKLSDTKVVFFECPQSTLRGFSGPNTMYFNVTILRNMIRDMNVNLSFDNKILFLKLELIKLVQHELAHIVLRYVLNDLNFPSTSLVTDLKLKGANLSPNIYNELGIICEKKIFEKRIDYVKSSQTKVNYEYLKQFIEDFINEKACQFDLNFANVIPSKGKHLAIAFDEEEEDLVEED